MNLITTEIPVVAAHPVLTDLSVTPIAETIRHIWAERRSGDLLIRSRKATKMVFFENGRIVFAASNLRKERLGDGLLAMGEISAHDHHQATALVGKGVRFGDALVTAGIMKKAELGLSVGRWMAKLVLSIFDLKTGSASFDDRPCAIPDEYKVDISSAAILYQGARTMSNYGVVLEALGDLDRYTTLAARPDFPVEPEDLDILDAARQLVRLRDLVAGAADIDSDRMCALYGLLAAGVLGGPYDSAPEAPAAAPLASLREEIRSEMALSETLDAGTWLELAGKATPAQILSALEAKKARYELLLAGAGDDPTMATDIEMLLGRVSMTSRLARRQAEVQSGTAVERAHKPEAKAAPEPAAAPASPESPNLSMEIEHLQLEAGIRMSVSDFTSAAHTYARLVDLQPDNLEYRVRLAMAMARSPQMARQAESQFEEAIRMAPASAEVHFQLGLYYKGMRVHTRSIATFRHVLTLDPSHKKAKAELAAAAASSKESALDSLKRLLD